MTAVLATALPLKRGGTVQEEDGTLTTTAIQSVEMESGQQELMGSIEERQGLRAISVMTIITGRMMGVIEIVS